MTCGISGIVTQYLHFNSHPHEEDDLLPAVLLPSAIYFNSHPHEEDDADIYKHITEVENFNSHPHEEDDNDRNQICMF